MCKFLEQGRLCLKNNTGCDELDEMHNGHPILSSHTSASKDGMADFGSINRETPDALYPYGVSFGRHKPSHPVQMLMLSCNYQIQPDHVFLLADLRVFHGSSTARILASEFKSAWESWIRFIP